MNAREIIKMRENPKEHFLNIFQRDIRNNLTAFCELLWNRESDIFLFMARKAACLFGCLRELQLADVRGSALNDRVLDMDLSFVRGKSVTLVDDCIFTGTTLFNAKNAIEKAGGRSISTLTLAVNKDTMRHELLPNGSEEKELCISRPFFLNSNSECVRQCYDIVRAISLVPHPYDVDFPHTLTFKLKESKLDSLLNLPGWSAFNITSELQRQHDICAFTLIPHASVFAEFCANHGGSPSQLSSAKIRIYTRRTRSATHNVRLVPIVMFPPAETNNVVAALQSIFDEEDFDVKKVGFTSPRSCYRILHFIAAHALLGFFSRYASTQIGFAITTDLRHDLMEMSFGENAWSWYSDKRSRIENFEFPPTCASEMSTPADDYNKITTYTTVPESVVYKGFDPFTWLYRKREIATREDVKKSGLRVKTHYMNRLNEGFTPRFLFTRTLSEGVDTNRLLSLLLDRLVDMGVAVPMIAEDGSKCCRAFRHGEDAILGEAQERLILQAIEAYMKRKNVDFVWGLELQKIIVLFVQIAVRNQMMETINTQPVIPIGCRIVSIKGYLHGPVPVLERPRDPSGHMHVPFVGTGGDHPMWLINEWEERGYLTIKEKTGRGTKYIISKQPELSAGERADAQARQVGRCLGTANRAKTINSDSDLVMLSTCSEADHQLRALSGEIAIFRNRWFSVKSRVALSMEENSYAEAHQDLRTYRDVFTALNSGAKKFRWYISKTFEKKIQQVVKELRDAGQDAMADEWILLWPQAQPMDTKADTETWSTLTECGRWLLSSNVAIRIFDYWIVLSGLKHESVEEELATEIEEEIRMHANLLRQAFRGRKYPPFLKLVSNILKSLGQRNLHDTFQWYRVAVNELDRFARWYSCELLETVTAICSAYGSIKTITHYPYAIYIDIPGSVEDKSDYSQGNLDALYRAQEEARKKLGINNFIILQNTHNPWRTGQWTLLTGNRNSDRAVEMCRLICRELRRLRIPFRAIVIGQLSRYDCVRSFSGSTERGYGFFLTRLYQLQNYLLAGEFDYSITLVTDASSKADSEAKKFLKFASSKCKVVTSIAEFEGVEQAPRKCFEVSTCYFSPPSLQDAASSGSHERDRSISKSRRRRVLLCTATNTEDDAVVTCVNDAGYNRKTFGKERGIYESIEEVGDVDVFWVRSGMGSLGSDGSSLTTFDAIEDLSPHYVISCGLAFGCDPAKQSIGDILVSTWVRSYEKGRMGSGEFVPRGPKVPADPYLLQAARAVRRDVKDLCVREGGILSGEKLVDSADFKKSLWGIEPEAVGGEMEGAGIVDACSRRSLRWIVIKAICDWGENKESKAQPEAAYNAVRFTFEIISRDLLPAV